MINLNAIKVADILPQNLKNDKQVVFVAQALDQEFQEITNAIKLCIHLPRLDELDENVVDLLAWQYHVDFYNANLSVKRKKELVRQSIAWHRRKGTPAVVEEVVKAVYGNCVLQEWFEYDGKPYYFKVVVTLEEESTDKERWRGVIEAIESAKNVRSWLEKIEFYYPDIILPLKIQHRAEAIQIVDASHNVWNLGIVRTARWDGEFNLDGKIRLDALVAGEGYKERQTHKAEIWITLDAYQHNYTLTNVWDGEFNLDGIYELNGAKIQRLPLSRICTNLVQHAKQRLATKNNSRILEKIISNQKYYIANKINEKQTIKSYHSANRMVNNLDGSFCLDGSHGLEGVLIVEQQLNHSCTIELNGRIERA